MARNTGSLEAMDFSEVHKAPMPQAAVRQEAAGTAYQPSPHLRGRKKDDPQVSFTLRMPWSMRRELEGVAAQHGLSIGAIMLDMIETRLKKAREGQ